MPRQNKEDNNMQQLFRPSRLAMLVALAAAPAWVQAAYPAYKSGTAYKAGDIVSLVGALYVQRISLFRLVRGISLSL